MSAGERRWLLRRGLVSAVLLASMAACAAPRTTARPAERPAERPHLALVPLVKRGDRESEDARSTAVVVVDVARRTFQDVARAPWCTRCDGAWAELAEGETLPREVQVIDMIDAGRFRVIDLVWDGTRLTRTADAIGQP